jgi:exodeoxyribonuclease V alpha subunit
MEEREPEVERVKGELKKIRFVSENGEFGIAELIDPDRVMPITVVGNLLSAQPGETLELEGRWVHDPRYGKQFKFQALRNIPPATKDGIERYLSSGFIEGIGPVLAGRIVETFGAATLDVLDADPSKLGEVPGIGPKKLAKLSEAWGAQRAVRDVMVFLQSNGISTTYATKVYDLYGDEAVDVVQRNPYKLAEDIFGIGFKRADAIAMASGLRRDDIARLRAGVEYALQKAQGEGHVFLPMATLRESAAELLGLSADEAIGEAISSLSMSGQITVEPVPGGDAAVYRTSLYRAECDAARHLVRIATTPLLLAAPLSPGDVDAVAEEMGVTLAAAQREAVEAVWTDKLVVLTGGPGTGKTTIVRAVVELGVKFGMKMELAAPTGRAAKRLSEATGEPARTLHRMLEYSFQGGGFQYNDERPLDVDLLVVDEASMIDTYLMKGLASALPDHARLLLVGDIDQLPSVGAGSVLGDVLRSEVAHVVRLTEIFRQAQESHIVVNAHRINRGQMPELPPRAPGQLVDFYAIEAPEPAEAQRQIVRMVTERIPQAFGYDPVDEVQILSPMHKGDVGCAALNELLQDTLNPDAQEIVRGNRRFRVGDKVMQLRNNYEHDVFNGDIGRVREILDDPKQVMVDFDGALVPYELGALDELTLAYAITVHKSQGSEYPVVIVPMVTQHFILLQRNLLYTAITRAKSLVILVGTQKAVGIAVRNDTASERYTRLRWRLDRGLGA